ncbi:MAG: DUF1906 domain-containing protein [Methylobacteriaceae bacterium]|nr:DUF1906 domain-containing protein [Methylobacteriaceae bacterium]MBV9221259.1 DUF1906 domain-containing protein [Methylobacteriaceae bacterium]MBV9245969.1 DUF1906 domain-containing protein [Methylobacteriaceae bacterium]MBV9633723.1 DUF1906 domain-containing protein [Methylobacteriaceae bacterium]MBV9701735.1 DUF1906 domain-containing protein [Methylobacteriaceae bacterium]
MPGFAGLDTSDYPGTPQMGWLKKNTNLAWCGFYLGKAPSHPSTSWMKHRSDLDKQGWGFAPIYVGQQVTGPGTHNSSLAQGQADGKDAVALMGQAGFPNGSSVYLDIENGPPLMPVQHDYIAGWVDTVAAHQYQPGVYCSFLLAEEVHGLRSQARVWVFRVATTKPHPVPGPNYPDPHPGGSGYAGAFMWQLGMACQISLPGAPNGVLNVDLDSAVSADPSR